MGPVKAALLELWSEALAETNIQITYGNRVTTAAGERITIGGATGSTAPQSLGPRRQMTETYDVKCKVSVTRPGSVNDQRAVTERVLELFGVIEEALRSLPSRDLGLTPIDVDAAVEGDWELGEAEASDTGGPINSWYEFNVHVRARFRLP